MPTFKPYAFHPLCAKFETMLVSNTKSFTSNFIKTQKLLYKLCNNLWMICDRELAVKDVKFMYPGSKQRKNKVIL